MAIDLKRKLALDIAALAGPLRPPVLVLGRYVYCGSAFGAGGLLGALLLVTVNPAQDRRPLSSGFALAYGVLVVLAGLNPWSMALPVLLVLAGVAMTASNASARCPISR